MYRLVLWLLMFTAVPVFAAPGVIKIPKPQPDSKGAQHYYVELLRLALARGAAGRAVPVLEETSAMEQGRAIYELTRGAIADVYWMGTNIEREKKLRAIRIPLDRGLIGYRRFIIRADRQVEFNAVNNGADLKQLLGCQGLDWPDVDIMRAAALRVTEVAVLEGLFQQVVAKRCDYFPRGYYEAVPELAQRRLAYPELMEYQNLVLHYPFAIYFFVRRDNEELARWIEQGLEQMIDSGEFLAYITSHPLTSHIFPLHKNSLPTRTIHIANPFLPADTNSTNARYWFQPADFSADPPVDGSPAATEAVLPR
jgi:hypothetical protein